MLRQDIMNNFPPVLMPTGYTNERTSIIEMNSSLTISTSDHGQAGYPVYIKGPIRGYWDRGNSLLKNTGIRDR